MGAEEKRVHIERFQILGNCKEKQRDKASNISSESWRRKRLRGRETKRQVTPVPPPPPSSSQAVQKDLFLFLNHFTNYSGLIVCYLINLILFSSRGHC